MTRWRRALRVLPHAIESSAPQPTRASGPWSRRCSTSSSPTPPRADAVRRARGPARARHGTLAGVVADQAEELLGDQAAPPRGRQLGTLVLVSGTTKVFASWLRGEFDVTRAHLADFLVAMIRTTGDLATALRRERG